MEKAGLLEELREKIGCLYLSDLHEEKNREKIRMAVAEVDTEHYSLEEWKDACLYITGKTVEGRTEADFRQIF